MLGTLLKYDFREIGRRMGPLYGALAALSVATGALFATKGDKINTVDDALSAVVLIMVLALMFLFVAICVITLMLVVRNFSDTLFGRRGYLTNALPAHAIDHVADKTINGTIWALLTALMSVIAVALFATAIVLVNPSARESLLDSIGSVSLAWPGILEGAQGVGVAVISLLVFSTVIVSWLFAGISLGSMVRRRTGLAKAAAFVALALAWLLASNAPITSYAVLLLVQVVFALAFSAISTYVLSHHLNLE